MKIIKKILKLIILIIILMLATALCIYLINKKDATFTLIDITTQVNSEISIEPKDCINEDNYDASKLKIDLRDVNTKEVGVYPYYVYLGIYKKTGYINVVNEVKHSYKVRYNYITTYEDFDKDKLVYECDYEINGCEAILIDGFDKEVFKTPGKYNLTYRIKDNTNTYIEETTVEILSKEDWEAYQNNLKMINNLN